MTRLREPEHKILTALKNLNAKASVEQLVAATSMSDSAVMRAVLTLQENRMVQTTERKQTIAKLAEEGRTYARIELPERRLITALQELGGKAPLAEIVRKSGLKGHLVPIALGWIHRKKWATLDSKTRTLQIQSKPAEGADEELVKLLDKKKEVTVEDLSPELQDAFQLLKGRKLLNVEEKTRRESEITETGRATAQK